MACCRTCPSIACLKPTRRVREGCSTSPRGPWNRIVDGSGPETSPPGCGCQAPGRRVPTRGNCASFRFGDLPPDVAPAGGGARARMIRADLERRPGCADHRLDRGPGGGLPRAPRPVEGTGLRSIASAPTAPPARWRRKWAGLRRGNHPRNSLWDDRWLICTTGGWRRWGNVMRAKVHRGLSCGISHRNYRFGRWI